ncbi:PREDICTED: dimethyladenosine transferase 2, mitochondrial, partial [Ceratosolen solmsi marchali]|uniref:rRNA adenine N(6)-methyltransferase n=1 Tax=Ceratosolen solmsi marchali TaxID=326594 RepID=A0AAJ7E1S6_9HYME
MVTGNMQLQKLKNKKINLNNQKSKVISKHVSKFLQKTNQEHFVDIIPKRLLQNNCNKNSLLYLVDPSTAKDLTSIISPELLQDHYSVIECNPGLGLLTQELLNIGIQHITLLEKCVNFYNSNSPLYAIVLKYNTRLTLKYIPFNSFCLLSLRNKYLYQYDTEKSVISYSKYKRIAYIIPVANKTSISLIIYNFCNQTKLFDNRSIFYLIVSSSIWKDLYENVEKTYTQFSKHYNRYYIILKLFFNITLLGNLSRKAFLPWPNYDLNNCNINDSDFLMVIKMEPKLQYLFTKIDLKHFWYFLRYCMRSKTTRVIVELEKLVPGCGMRLILNNMNMCTRFKDLNPNQLLTLFNEFKSWPE